MRPPSLRQFSEARDGRGQLEAQVRAEQPGRMARIRAAGHLLLAVAAYVIPYDAASTTKALVSATILAVLALGVLIEFKVPPGRTDLAHNFVSILATVAVVSLVPALWFGGFVCLACIVVGALAVEPRGVTYFQFVLATVCMSVAGEAQSVEGWWVPVAGFVAIFGAIDSFFVTWRERRAESDRRYDTLISTAGLFFWELDLASCTFTSITGNTVDAVGYTPSEIVGMDWADLVVGGAELDPAVLEHEETELLLDLVHRSGSTVAFRHLIHKTDDGLRLQGAATEISELARATATIRRQAEHDSLTDLSNRSVLLRDLRAALLTRKSRESVALLILDLNRFKEVNDTLGHPVGDQLLQVLASRFAHSVDADTIARLGGDEFAFLVTGDVSTGSAMQLAHHIAALTDQRIELNRITLSVSASIGVAVAPQHGIDAETLMQHADIAMYEAKAHREPARLYLATPGNLSVERLTLTSELSSAINRSEFELYFQPKLDLGTGRIIGAEGLARWRHPARGILAPDQFLELLTLSGDYHQFTDEMISEGIQFADRCRRSGYPIEVAVNLSSMSFFDDRLPDRVAELLEAYGVPPAALTLEITEADILDDSRLPQATFARLADLGVGLSIDDFGTGYSSLVRLRKLPVSELKIDQSFVRGLGTEPEDLIIVRTIIDLASVLGHQTVAEGVETREVAEILTGLGCEIGQGFYFGRPMPADAFVTALCASPVIGSV